MGVGRVLYALLSKWCGRIKLGSLGDGTQVAERVLKI
jgi:hypothetical protein